MEEIEKAMIVETEEKKVTHSRRANEKRGYIKPEVCDKKTAQLF